MKKILSLVLCVSVLAFGLLILTGCPSEPAVNDPTNGTETYNGPDEGRPEANGETSEAYALYQRMNQAMADVTSLDMDMEMTMEMTMEDIEIASTTTGRVQQVFRSETDIDMAITMVMTMTGYGDPITEESRIYFRNGRMYMESYGMKFYMEMDLEEALESLNSLDILDFSERAIISANVSTVAGGNRKVKLVLEGDEIGELMDTALASLEGMLGEIAGDVGIEFTSDVILDFVIDENYMLVSYRMAFEMEVTAEGETVAMKMDTTMTINSINSITEINFPNDLDEYVSMEEAMAAMFAMY